MAIIVQSGCIVYISVSTGQDVPGHTGMGRPIVPLSQDKQIFLSRCPFAPGQGQEQKFRIPGQIPLSRDVLGQNEYLSI